ncbi:general odorant-binding protein 66 [Drosophila subpulchrella]|uniref:general odorant-binding protein 66 n=1 Tax=Drosophila subpulchrella TaxID=1486046 RepID=UPI0018A13105|nr:general odorant-binding protein 66 [Drosophila subpulchrella]
MKCTILWCFISLIWFASGIKIDCENPEGINEEHIHYCCKHPDGHNDIIEDCARETNFLLPNQNEEALVDITADRAIRGTCFGKCVFSKLNLMKDKALDMDAVRTYFTEKFPDDPEYVKEMINAFDHCHGKSEEITSTFLAKPLFRQMSEHYCEPKSSVILACVIRQFFHNCPADRWSKTKECEDTLAFSKKCQDSLATL